MTQETNPRKRPVFPGARCSTNEPCKQDYYQDSVKWLASTYGIFPIGKPIGPVLRIATNHGDKSVANES